MVLRLGSDALLSKLWFRPRRRANELLKKVKLYREVITRLRVSTMMKVSAVVSRLWASRSRTISQCRICLSSPSSQRFQVRRSCGTAAKTTLGRWRSSPPRAASGILSCRTSSITKGKCPFRAPFVYLLRNHFRHSPLKLCINSALFWLSRKIKRWRSRTLPSRRDHLSSNMASDRSPQLQNQILSRPNKLHQRFKLSYKVSKQIDSSK